MFFLTISFYFFFPACLLKIFLIYSSIFSWIMPVNSFFFFCHRRTLESLFSFPILEFEVCIYSLYVKKKKEEEVIELGSCLICATKSFCSNKIVLS